MARISMTWPQYLRGCFSIDGKEHYLPPVKFLLVSHLIMNMPRVTPRSEMIEAIWSNPDNEPEQAEKTILVHVHQINKALGVKIIENRVKFGLQIAEDYR